MSATPARILGTCSNCLAELFVPLEGTGDTPVVCRRCGAHALSYYPLLPMGSPANGPVEDVEALKNELKDLRRWKAEALAVEAQWDLQELAKNLGIPPGLGIQKEIPKRLEALLEYVRDLEVLGDRAVDRLKNLTEVHSGREMVRKWHERRLKKP